MTWAEVLQYAQVAKGVAAIVGCVIFVASEYIPGFIEQIENRKVKRLVVLGLSMAIPVGALLLEIVTVRYTPITVETLWAAVSTGLASFGSATFVQTTVMKKKA